MTNGEAEFDFGDERSWWGRLAKMVAVAAVLGGVGAAAWYFIAQDDETEAAPVAQQEVVVTTGQLVSSFLTTGSAEADLSVDLSFGVGGTVQSVSVSEGDVVSKGDEIARLESDDLVRSLASAEASLEIARLQLEDLLAGADTEARASAAQSVTNALSSVANAEGNLEDAGRALSDAYLGPDDSALGAADDAISQAETSLQSAENQMDSALASLTDAYRDYCGLYNGTSNALPCNSNGIGSEIPLDDDEVEALTDSLAVQTGSVQSTAQISQAAQSLISANGQYESAELNLDRADDDVSEARAERLALFDPPTADEIKDLEDMVDRERRSLESARLGLTVAYERQAELFEEPDPLTLIQREEAVRAAEQQLEDARENLARIILVAPFDGTVGALTVEAGDVVGAATTIATLTDTEQITIELTVSEADLPGLEAGQLGLAEFSALPDEQYVVEIVSVATLPNVTQGVVTYPVIARVLGPSDLNSLEGGAQRIAQVLAALGSGNAAAFEGGNFGGFTPDGAGRSGQGANGDPGPGGQGGFAGLRQLLQLTTQDEDGTLRLPEGVEIPEDLELPEGFVINDDGTVQVPEGFSIPGGDGGFVNRGGVGAPGDDDANPDGVMAAVLDAPLPSPGMSATVTILLEIQTDVLLVPNAALSIQAGAASVRVLNAGGTEEQRPITIGDSDSANTIVLSGLVAGETVLVIGSVVTVPVQADEQQGGFGGQGGQGGFGGQGGQGGFGGQGQRDENPGGAN